MTVVLCELELTIKRVKVSTTPDGRVMDLFFITDTRYTIFCLSNKITLRITCNSLPCLAFYSCVFAQVLWGREILVLRQHSCIGFVLFESGGHPKLNQNY